MFGKNSVISYGELAAWASALQGMLPQAEGRPIAAVFLPDGGGFLAALFAVLQNGWTAFPLNTGLKQEELSQLLQQADVQVIVTSEEFYSRCQAAIDACTEKPAILRIEAASPDSEIRSAEQAERPNSVMLLLASSGTMGHVKLVQLSEANIVFTVRAYLEHMGYEKNQDTAPRYALGTPMFGIYGLLVSFACVLRGFPLFPMAEKFTLETFYRAVEDWGISHYDGGTLIAVLVDRTLGRAIPYDISTLRYFGFGGSKVPEGTLQRLRKAFPQVRFWSGYGMTEASPLIAQPFQALPDDKLESVGLPLPGVEVRVEKADGTDARPCELGEIIARGPNLMLGYYKNEAATRELIPDGWLHTGDIGYFDQDGYLYICGRKKNMLLVRGFNVYPEEVETRLLTCPLVKDCVVYGAAEESLGTEVVCADIVPAQSEVTPQAIQGWCAEHLAHDKRPQCIRMVQTLQKTSTGKNLRPREAGLL